MQVQDIEFEERHGVGLLFQEGEAFEAAGLVYHKAPVPETRIIQNGAAGKWTQSLKLLQGGSGPENAFLRKGFNPYFFPADGKPISLLLLPRLKLGHLLSESPPAQLYLHPAGPASIGLRLVSLGFQEAPLGPIESPIGPELHRRRDNLLECNLLCLSRLRKSNIT